jgi:alkane 1-monooxygenase
MALFRYLTPFAFLALMPLGACLGGAWTFMAAAATPLCLAGLDAVLGDDAAPARPANGWIPRWLPRIYIVLQLAAMVFAVAWIAQTSTSLVAAAGLALSLGVTTGVFGIVAAHEMIHSRSAGERALGLALLGSIFYMHFRIAHVYGHHRRAATFEDPASARMGEGLYAFLARSITGQFREAWAFEARRRKRAGRAAIGPGNRMVAYVAIEVSLLFTIGLVSGRALALLIATALAAVSLLESFNYVAHYGLSRRTSIQGHPERLGPEHSWNSAKLMNNAALFNMGRHSDHHLRTTRPYAQLETVPGAAELPSGYAAALLTALIPPLWRRVMDPRARAVVAGRFAQRKLQAGTP